MCNFAGYTMKQSSFITQNSRKTLFRRSVLALLVFVVLILRAVQPARQGRHNQQTQQLQSLNILAPLNVHAKDKKVVRLAGASQPNRLCVFP
jgi:hypothetical protein